MRRTLTLTRSSSTAPLPHAALQHTHKPCSAAPPTRPCSPLTPLRRVPISRHGSVSAQQPRCSATDVRQLSGATALGRANRAVEACGGAHLAQRPPPGRARAPRTVLAPHSRGRRRLRLEAGTSTLDADPGGRATRLGRGGGSAQWPSAAYTAAPSSGRRCCGQRRRCPAA